MTKLVVVIVSWNTVDLTRDCLRSLYDELAGLDGESEVWVVDNASEDSSAAMIKDEFPQVRLIENTENVGFARANNQVLRIAEGSYYLLLNSDTVVPLGSLQQLINYARENPAAAAIGPRLLHPNGKIQHSFWPLPSLMGELRYCLVYHFFPFGRLFRRLFNGTRIEWTALSKPIKVQALSAACVLIRREVIDTIGILAEDYFLFSEENDYFCRMREAGFSSYYLPDIEIIHLVGASRDKRGTIDSQVHFLRSRLVYYRRRYSRAVKPLLAIYRFFLGWSSFQAHLSYLIKGRKNDEFIRLYRQLRQTLAESK